MYARDPSLIIISATGIFQHSHSLVSFVRRIPAIFHHGCQAPLKPPKTSGKKEGKGACMPGFYFFLFWYEGSYLTGLLFNAEAFSKPFKSISCKGLREAIRYLF
jgi:hypothetical protein